MTHVKLGLFALLAGVAVIATALGLGVHALRTASLEYHTYFDESVQGLDLGSPVKYRGVRIGRVSQIDIAPDRQHVDVVLAIASTQVERLGIADTSHGLRAQLASQGVTGVKFVDLDFFDPTTNPPPALGFAPAGRYVPARASVMKGLIDNLEAVGPRLPVLADQLDTTLAKISKLADDLTDEQVVRRVGTAVDAATALTVDARRLVRRLDGARLDEQGRIALQRAADAAARIDALVARLDNLPAFVNSARGAADAVREVERSSRGASAELERTLQDLGDAARSVRELADELQRDPDMLVKGRARSTRP